MIFDKALEKGLEGESIIARWLIRRGNSVLPVYETKQEFKGPRVFTSSGELVATDMFVFSQGKAAWIEAKTKSAFTLHAISKTWQTGIDVPLFNDYLEVKLKSGIPTYLLFLQEAGNCAKDSPAGCPSGLYGQEIDYLHAHEDHRWPKNDPKGMVYWGVGVLRKYASLIALGE